MNEFCSLIKYYKLQVLPKFLFAIDNGVQWFLLLGKGQSIVGMCLLAKIWAVIFHNRVVFLVLEDRIANRHEIVEICSTQQKKFLRNYGQMLLYFKPGKCFIIFNILQ